jgi:oligoribonuclease NrnB/cAMP/cGMP phosphodiesterase (DHH superfamily)
MSDKSNFNYAIYHKGCLDGFSGFFVANLSGRLTKNVEIYPDVPSATMVPPNIDGKDIIIIDCAYKKEILEIIFTHARSVVFIDHHDSIKNDVEELHKKYGKQKEITIIYDETRCGATLTWKYFFGRQEIPLFLKYVEDQDTGKWIYPKTKPFIYALRVYYNINTEKKTLDKWFKLLNKETIGGLIKKGLVMEMYNNHLVSVNLPRHTLESFPSKRIYDIMPNIFKKVGQYRVAVFCGHNCPSVTDLATTALDRLDCDFTIMWVYNLDNKKYVVSMRSKVVDVGEICKIFSGGGHKLAAAGSFLSSEYRIEDLFEGHSLPRKFKDHTAKK